MPKTTENTWVVVWVVALVGFVV
eukprot:SAG31_NODE_23073_length_512_cov_0.627119_2_plen_22_part_01